MTRFRHTLSTLTLATLAWASGPALADSYPERPIHLVVGYAPGGPTDILARQIAPVLAEVLGQQVVVDNKPGASGNIGGNDVARAKPDGYTLLLGDLTLATNPSLMQRMPFEPQTALTPIAPLAKAPLALVVHPDVPANSLGELLDYARANPGKLTYGTAGNGNLTHLAGEVLKARTGVDIRQVPYKGSGPAITDLVGGQIAMVITGLSSTEGFIQAGKLRPLAITGTQRSAALPEVPTFREATGLPLEALDVGSWWGLFGPANLPEAVVATLNQATRTALARPDLQARLKGMNIEADPGSPADQKQRLASETATWQTVIQQAGIVPQ